MTASSLTPLRIAIAGASGRMGKMLIDTVLQAADCTLAAALAPAEDPALGQDAGAPFGRTTGMLIRSDVREALTEGQAQFLIDFTRPEGTLAHLNVCRKLGVKMVIGTTGFSEVQKQQIAETSQTLAIVLSPNMSVGVNVLFKLLELATRALQPGYDIEIIEAHHRNKVDAPSGTAVQMGEVIAGVLGKKLSDIAVYERYGHTGERPEGTIGFATVRGGDIVGDHTALFAGIGERVEITHKSSSRATYAQGSLRAVRFLAERASGLYDMQNVLGLQ